MIYTSKVFPYPYFGLIEGRIEVDVSHGHRPLQRHIWTRENGTIDAQDWILTLPGTTAEKLVARGWSPIES